jgi:hypothetical protein
MVSSIIQNLTRLPPADLSKIAQAAGGQRPSAGTCRPKQEAGAYEETARWETGRQACREAVKRARQRLAFRCVRCVPTLGLSIDA